jgi:hypothetical protein
VRKEAKNIVPDEKVYEGFSEKVKTLCLFASSGLVKQLEPVCYHFSAERVREV